MSRIIVNYSRDYINAAMEILAASSLKEHVRPGMRVSLKPNLVLAKPASEGATTHVVLCEALIIYLKELGVSQIEIIESAWLGGDTKQAFRVCGYDTLSKRYGVPLYDLKDDNTVKINAGEFRLEICRKAVETDFLINVPVLKAHCQTTLTCCLKNLKGLIPDREKRRFHVLGLHKPIAYLNTVIHTGFCLVDGICGDLSFEEGGHPVARHMLLASEDPVLADSYCAGLIGCQIKDVAYLSLAAKLKIGKLFDASSEIIALNHENKPAFNAKDRVSNRLAAHIEEDRACSACYASLIHALYRLDEQGLLAPDLRINIGQGFKGKSGKLGCGSCTNGCSRYVKGCPPKADEIVRFLMQKQ